MASIIVILRYARYEYQGQRRWSVCKIWCCRRGLNTRPLPYQQHGSEPHETPWGNVLGEMAFSASVPPSAVQCRRVSLETGVSAARALPSSTLAFRSRRTTRSSRPSRLTLSGSQLDFPGARNGAFRVSREWTCFIRVVAAQDGACQ